MKQFVRKHTYEIILFLIVAVLFVANYKPGTYLVGWDSLQTDLNPLLGVKRAIFSVWEEYQSFGLVSGMAHAADFIRSFFVYLISFILPQSLIRYTFHFLMILVGGLGMYRLLILVLDSTSFRSNNKIYYSSSESEITSDKSRSPAFPFLGSLFYILNLGTLQIMFLPYEPFSIFFAMLPWTIWIFIKNIVRTGHCPVPTNKRYLILFFFANLLITPAFYVQTLFIVYLMILGMITAGIVINSHPHEGGPCLPAGRDPINTRKFMNWIPVFTGMTKQFKNFKKIIVLFSVIFLINSFWLLPQIYFLKKSGNVVTSAKINVLSTEDTFYQNREKGTFPYFLKMEGYYYNLFDMKGKYLFSSWIKHFNTPVFTVLQYLFAAVIILGLFRKNKYRLPFIFIFIITLIALLSATPPFSFINDLLRKNNIINQIFRSPFTKFIIPYSFVASYFFANGLILVLILLQRFIKNIKNQGFWTRPPNRRSSQNDVILGSVSDSRIYGSIIKILNLKTIFFISTIIFIILYSLPAFTGNYISSQMQVKIPTRYFELMDYFKTVDKNKRIAMLPDYTFWGWFFNKWGYNGSGFLWYGIEQPIISRTFDVWSNVSENYFWEIKSTSEAEDVKNFDKVLEKYNIDYLILDYTLLPVSSTLKGMQYDRLDNILNESSKITQVRNWKDLKLFKVEHDKRIESFTTISSNLPNIGPNIHITNDDSAYKEYGDYMTDQSGNFEVYYPFLDLTTQTRIPNKTWKITEDEDNFYITGNLINLNTKSEDTDGAGGRGGRGPDPTSQELRGASSTRRAMAFRSFSEGGKETSDRIWSSKLIDQKSSTLTVSFPKTLYTDFDLKKANVQNCSYVDKMKNNLVGTGDNLSLLLSNTNGSSACLDFNNQYLEQQTGYIIKIKNENQTGRPLFFYVLDQTKKQAFIEDRLKNPTEYYVLPPRFKSGLGYYFDFQNTSYQNQTSTNKLQNISIYSLPYDEIKNTKLMKPNEEIKKAQFANDFSVKKKNYFVYQINLPNKYGQGTALSLQTPQTIVLYQSFHPGWEAYYVKNFQFSFFNFLNTYFPYFLGEKIDSHFSVNNWANGWKIDQNVDSNTIVLIFWPQYLQIIGYIILVGIFVYIVLQSFDKTFIKY